MTDHPPHSDPHRADPPDDELSAAIRRYLASSVAPTPGPAGRVTPGDSGSGCPDPLALAAYLDGRSTADEAETLERHLANCAGCFEAVRDLRTILAELGDPAAPRVVVPTPVTTAARSLVTERRPRPGPRSSGRRLWPSIGRWGVAAAASLAVCTVGYRTGLAAFGVSELVSDELLAEVSFGALDASGADAAGLTLLVMTSGEDDR